MTKREDYQALTLLYLPPNEDKCFQAFCEIALQEGVLPIVAPHLDDKIAMKKLNLILLGKADEFWLFRNESNEQMEELLRKAHFWKKKIRLFHHDFEEGFVDA
ncbi:hypothetical protein AK24_04845 [Listeria monocytogenes]|nr:hypothetical protein [Listeria monocytogenes]